MSKIKYAAESKFIVTLVPKESILLSASRDLITFGFMLLCIYVSHGSTFWTFLTGTMFVVYLAGKIRRAIDKSANVFRSKKEAIDFIDKQDIPE